MNAELRSGFQRAAEGLAGGDKAVVRDAGMFALREVQHPPKLLSDLVLRWLVKVEDAHGPGTEASSACRPEEEQADIGVARVLLDAVVEGGDGGGLSLEDLKEVTPGGEEHAGDAAMAVLAGRVVADDGEQIVVDGRRRAADVDELKDAHTGDPR